MEETLKLSEIGDGSLEERFQKALEEVIWNIKDLTTDEKKTREITIKLKFKPNEKRDQYSLCAVVTNKLAPVRELGSSAVIEVDKNGLIATREYSSDYPGQVSIND